MCECPSRKSSSVLWQQMRPDRQARTFLYSSGACSTAFGDVLTSCKVGLQVRHL